VKSIVFILLASLALTSACSFKRVAVNQVGNALAGGGTTFASEDDPALIRDAAPFSLKLMESLLAESPNHKGLLLALTSGFTQYGYAFVQPEADELETRDMAGAAVLRDRARKLYLRARHYGLRGLEVNHRGFQEKFRHDAPLAVRQATKADVPLLYWTAAAWGACISISKDRTDVVADVPKVQALIERALALDETFDHGAIHSFLISYEMARPGAKPAEAVALAKQHFDRAVALGAGKLAGPLVTYAEAVCIQKQQRAEFEKLLKQALAIDVDQLPDTRLVNLVMQRRARWLLSKVDELFAE
jgi:predicted anti-sigma-YlaC factor YlaD